MNDREWAAALVKHARMATQNARDNPGTGYEGMSDAFWAEAACALLAWLLVNPGCVEVDVPSE